MTEKFQPIFPQHIDSTILSTYKSCSYKAFIEHIRGIQPASKSIHLHFGGLIASALEIARNAFYLDGKSPEESIMQGSEYILENFGDWDEDDIRPKTLKNCLWAFENYLRQAYPLGQDRFVPYEMHPGDRPMIEFSFALPMEVEHPVTGNPIMYSGRCDMIAADSKAYSKVSDAEQVWTVDEKTTQRMGATWAEQWRLRGQCIGYTWAAQCSGIPATGALVRGICVYKEKEPKFEQTFIQHNEAVIGNWYRQANDTLARMVNDWRRGYWPQDFDKACQEYDGCQYISTCELADPEPYYQVKYVERRWDPLNRVEIEGEQ